VKTEYAIKQDDEVAEEIEKKVGRVIIKSLLGKAVEILYGLETIVVTYS
jgi:hypothetical protein